MDLVFEELEWNTVAELVLVWSGPGCLPWRFGYFGLDTCLSLLGGPVSHSVGC